MKKILNKEIVLFILIVFLVSFSSTVSAKGWYTAKTLVTPEDKPSGKRGLFSIGRVGTDTSLINASINQVDSNILLTDNLSEPNEINSIEFYDIVNYLDSSTPKLYQLQYKFTYENSKSSLIDADVYVRFKPKSSDPNFILVDGIRVYCLQTLKYIDQYGGLIDMPRLDFTNQDSYWYYLNEVSSGSDFTVVYTLLLPSGIELDANERFLDFETVQTCNHSSVLRWNVLFESGLVYPYDNSTSVDGAYYSNNIDLEALYYNCLNYQEKNVISKVATNESDIIAEELIEDEIQSTSEKESDEETKISTDGNTSTIEESSFPTEETNLSIDESNHHTEESITEVSNEGESSKEDDTVNLDGNEVLRALNDIINK